MFLIIAGKRNKQYFGDFETEEEAKVWANDHLKDGTRCEIRWISHINFKDTNQ